MVRPDRQLLLAVPESSRTSGKRARGRIFHLDTPHKGPHARSHPSASIACQSLGKLSRLGRHLAAGRRTAIHFDTKPWKKSANGILLACASLGVRRSLTGNVEIGIFGGKLTIHSGRMKNKKEHRLPCGYLSDATSAETRALSLCLSGSGRFKLMSASFFGVPKKTISRSASNGAAANAKK